MDELELLRQSRPDAGPHPDAVARARDRLRAAVGTPVRPPTERPGDVSVIPFDTSSRRRAGPRAPVAAAAAAALAAVVVAGVILARDEAAPLSTGPTTTPGAPADGAAGGPFTCGPQLPFAAPTLDGFTGPVAGPSGDGLTAPEPGQLTLHWISPTGSIEARWPSDAAGGGRRSDHGAQPDAGAGFSVAAEPRPVASGRQVVEIRASDGRWSGDATCQEVQLVVADDDPAAARAAGSRLYALLTEPGGPLLGPAGALVTRSVTADAPPEVPPCDAPAGVAHEERVGGPVDLGTFATAEEALRAFIESKRIPDTDPFGFPSSLPGVTDRGYVATRLPDGSVAFAATIELGVTVVHAVPASGGWRVDRWEATGC